MSINDASADETSGLPLSVRFTANCLFSKGHVTAGICCLIFYHARQGDVKTSAWHCDLFQQVSLEDKAPWGRRKCSFLSESSRRQRGERAVMHY